MNAAEAWQQATAHGLVVLAGAGVSMGAPSSLPGWTDINDAFLDNLGLLLAMHTDGEVGYDVAQFVHERREAAAVVQPDLQAQLAEESLSERYFGLFEPLDIETWNDGHAAIAAIAASGLLRAVVTTNFDRLIELAIDAAGARASVYCGPEEFERLAAELEAGDAPVPGTIPVIKVHGSVGRAETMVDTLRQRVLGRPQALEAALAALFRRHATLVVGFSGADLAYDPGYLGLRDGAAASPSFTVVNRAGDEPNEALAELVESAVEHARIVDGTLPQCLDELATAAGHKGGLVAPEFDVEMEHPGARRESLRAQVGTSWAQSISPVSAAVVLASIAKAAGSGDAAFQLLTKTMPHHLRAGLKADPALPRQLGLIAETLIEACHVDQELSAGVFEGGSAALTLLSADLRLDTESLALFALALSLVGEPARSDAAALQALRESREQFTPTVRADTVWILARRQTLSELWEASWLGIVHETYDLMYNWGDEPRRARLGAMLVRYLVETGQADAAAPILADCQGVARRLGLVDTNNHLLAALGRLYLAEGRYDDALRVLSSTCRHAEASQQNLLLAETLLPLARAAAAAGDANLLQQSLARFDGLLPLIPGMGLPRAALQVRLLCSAGGFDEARGAVAELRSLNERWGFHPWIGELANRLDARIDLSSGQARVG
jgi:tetratricopeptide (TPR) repeat protein